MQYKKLVKKQLHEGRKIWTRKKTSEIIEFQRTKRETKSKTNHLRSPPTCLFYEDAVFGRSMIVIGHASVASISCVIQISQSQLGRISHNEDFRSFSRLFPSVVWQNLVLDTVAVQDFRDLLKELPPIVALGAAVGRAAKQDWLKVSYILLRCRRIYSDVIRAIWI